VHSSDAAFQRGSRSSTYHRAHDNPALGKHIERYATKMPGARRFAAQRVRFLTEEIPARGKRTEHQHDQETPTVPAWGEDRG
jgi:hypothetical protein